MADAPPPPSAGATAAVAPLAPAKGPIWFDTLILIALRVVYFLVSRRYLLSTLNPTLREISKPEQLLPTQRARALSASTGGGADALDALRSDPEPDDTDADAGDSSYPPSPARGYSGGFTPLGAHTPTGPGTGSIELDVLGARLQAASDRGEGSSTGLSRRDAAAQQQLVLEVAHSRETSSTSVGSTKRVKRAARGLNRVARVLFSICVAESLNLLTLVVFHTVGILHSHARRVNFSVSLHLLLGIVLLVVPFGQCLLFTYRSRESTTVSTRSSRFSTLPLTYRLLISLIPFCLYIFIFTRIPPYITAMPEPQPEPAPEADASGAVGSIVQWSTSGPEGWERGGWLASSLGRVVVLGVLVIAGLSGIGAVVTAWDYLEQAAGAGRKPLTDADVLQAERSLYRVRHDIVTKRQEIERMEAPMEREGEAKGSWMSRVFGSKADSEAASLRTELHGLEQMEFEVSRSVAAMKIRHKRQGFRHTVKGTVYNILGYIFAIYCAARLLMCLVSIFIAPLSTSRIPESNAHKGSGNTNGDWISFILALGVAHLPFGDVDVATWSRAISLLLTGLLILSSLTMVLRWLGRVLRLTSKTVGAGFLLLTLGQLFATYVISLLVQLRTSLPPAPVIDIGTGANATAAAAAYESSDDSLLRTLPDFRVFGRLFDAVFLLAALGTGIYRYIAMKVGGADDGDLYQALGRE